jgi:RNA polymerase sigma factor (sigma-70 family)
LSRKSLAISAEEIAENHDLQLTLLRAIQALPPNFRTVVLLRYLAQPSFVEIGKKLNMPTTTAKTYFHRAKILLRKGILEQC